MVKRKKRMHGFNSVSTFLVNAEVDSMGGIIDGGEAVDRKTPPCHAAIEKAQAELRQEYDVREEKRRELEFLEKGGNPLDFKIGPATSVSVHSTSVADHQTDHEAKSTFALPASPHGDSVDSSTRPLGKDLTGVDNLVRLDGEKGTLQGDKHAICSSRNGDKVSSEQSSGLDRFCNRGKDLKHSAIFCLGVGSQAYTRRNRSRPNRESAHASSNNLVSSGRSSIVPLSRCNSRDINVSSCEKHAEKGHAVSSISHSKTTSPNTNMTSRTVVSGSQMVLELGSGQGHLMTVDSKKDVLATGTEFSESEGNQNYQMEVEGGITSGHAMSHSVSEKKGNFISAHQINGYISNMDEKDLKIEGQINRNCSSGVITAPVVPSAVGPESELSFHKVTCITVQSVANATCLASRKVNCGSNVDVKEQLLISKGAQAILESNFGEDSETKSVDMQTTDNDVLISSQNNLSVSDVQVIMKEEVCNDRSDLRNDVRPVNNAEDLKLVQVYDTTNSLDNGACPEVCNSVSLNHDTSETTLLVKSSPATELENGSGNHPHVVNKEHEDAILDEAQIIEATCKRILELSRSNAHQEKRQKSHWDFVLEEMTWLANDFMQERVWKLAAAAQVSQCVAFSGWSKFYVENLRRKQRKVSHTLAKVIMEFWHSVELQQDGEIPKGGFCGHCSTLVFRNTNGVDSVKYQEDDFVSQGTGKNKKEKENNQNLMLPIQKFALRFLKYSKLYDYSIHAEAPTTPDKKYDARILQLSCDDRFSEEILFYTVPFGAMEKYRRSMESHWVQIEKVGNATCLEESETSMFESVAEFGSQEIANEEAGESGFCYLPENFDGSKASNFSQRVKKSFQKSSAARYQEMGSNLRHGPFMKSKPGNNSLLVTGKRPSNGLNGCLIPIKRTRTAARQRVAGVSASGQLVNKTDGSSGDASSLLEEHSLVHVGSHSKKTLAADSAGDFVQQFPFESTDISLKPKKQKAKHTGYKNTLSSADSVGFISLVKVNPLVEHQWPLDSMSQHEQTDYSRKRYDDQQLESNGNSDMYVQHAAKKIKLSKQLPDASADTVGPTSGLVLSPVSSQMCNMPNPNKVIKLIASRDRGRKLKALKMSTGQIGSGIPWSLYEDQALVVLVHDLGPNWELVSDAINSTLKFKCIFRKPTECKEHHKELMDRSTGDGADSAVDSGCSQPYPSTLPGIPKGSATQLFQRLQGPMEGNTLTAHFEKIILIGQKLLVRRSQNDGQEMKPITTAVHSSHILALSQACPNNLNGSVLMPLDLCDTTKPNLDVVSPGYQVSNSGGFPVTHHHSSVASVLPSSGASPMLQGSSGMILGNSLVSSSGTLNGINSKDMQRYGMPKSPALPVDEQQKMQHYGQMLPSRSMQHSSAPVTDALAVGNDHSVSVTPAASGMDIMCGTNRRMAMSRPGLQGIGSSSMVNMVSPRNVFSCNGVGLSCPANISKKALSGQGRPRENLQVLRPSQNPEDCRQMMMQEHQMQVAQGSGPGGIAYNGLNTAFANQTVAPVQILQVQHQQQQHFSQQSHALGNSHHSQLQGTTNHGSHQQAYAIRLAKERCQLQQRFLQQQQFAAPNSLVPHAQPQLQHPMPSLPNNSQIQQQSSTQQVPQQTPNSQRPLTRPISLPCHQKHQHGPQVLSHNPQTGGALPSQMLKQQRQQHQLQPRQHSQHGQQSQQTRQLKGVGRGSMMMHPLDGTHVNGLAPAAANHTAEKGEQPLMDHMQGQGLFPSTGCSTGTQGKQMGTHPLNQVKVKQQKFSHPLQALQNQQPHTTADLDSNESQVQFPVSLAMPAYHQPILSPPFSLTSQRQQQTSLQQQQLQNQTSELQQAVQRMLPKSCHTSSDAPMRHCSDQIEERSQMSNTFQMGVDTNPQCTAQNHVHAVSTSTTSSQLKEPLHDKNASATPRSPSMGNSHPSNSTGSELLSSSSQRSTSHGQFAGSVPIHAHGVGQRLQQSQQQLQLQQQQQKSQSHQTLEGQVGSLHSQPSISEQG